MDGPIVLYKKEKKKKKKRFIDFSIESNLEILNANQRDVLRTK